MKCELCDSSVTKLYLKNGASVDQRHKKTTQYAATIVEMLGPSVDSNPVRQSPACSCAPLTTITLLLLPNDGSSLWASQPFILFLLLNVLAYHSSFLLQHSS